MLRLIYPDGSFSSLHPDHIPFFLSGSAHEAGHAVIALHFRVQVRGILLVYSAKRSRLELTTWYGKAPEVSLEDECTICAGGGAGEMVAVGRYTQESVSKDRVDADSLSCGVSFENLVEKGRTIILEHREHFDRITQTLRDKMFRSNQCLRMEPIVDGQPSVYLMRKHEFR